MRSGVTNHWGCCSNTTTPIRQQLGPFCQQALAARGLGWLATDETRQLLLAMGLPVAPGGVAHSAEEAIQLAKDAGFPVALKALPPM